jgi:hypothetical protein
MLPTGGFILRKKAWLSTELRAAYPQSLDAENEPVD